MTNLPPREEANFKSMLEFLSDHPPYTNELSRENDVDEEYSAAISAAFPNDADNVISVVAVTRYKVTILGLEIIDCDRQLEAYYGEHGECLQVGYTHTVPVVRLQDGSVFVVKSPQCLAELRAMLAAR